MAELPYPGIPANTPIRIVEVADAPATATTTTTTTGNTQTPSPHIHQPAHPHHFSFPRLSLHRLTLKSHRNHHGAGAAKESTPTTPTASWTPSTDIRETHHAYHIEIEVPGITDKDAILIQWLSPHTLLVQGEVKRPTDIGALATTTGARVWEGEADGWPKEVGRGEETQDGAPLVRTPSRETTEAELLADATPTVMLAERRLGPWRRTFTLPEDGEMRELRARLEGGLLRVELPKRERGAARGVRIVVE